TKFRPARLASSLKKPSVLSADGSFSFFCCKVLEEKCGNATRLRTGEGRRQTCPDPYYGCASITHREDGGLFRATVRRRCGRSPAGGVAGCTGDIAQSGSEYRLAGTTSAQTRPMAHSRYHSLAASPPAPRAHRSAPAGGSLFRSTQRRGHRRDAVASHP